MDRYCGLIIPITFHSFLLPFFITTLFYIYLSFLLPLFFITFLFIALRGKGLVVKALDS